MLSPDTIRTLTSWLVNATEPSTPTAPPGPTVPTDAAAPTDPVERAGDAPPPYALLVLHDGEAFDAPPGTRCMSGVAVAIHPILVDAYHGGLVDLLPDLAAALAPPHRTAANRPTQPHTVVHQRAAEALTSAFAPPQTGLRLLACAVAYDDIHTDTDDPNLDDHRNGADAVVMVRRVDAVDIDGRVYQSVRLPGGRATILVDDEPDPIDTPATHAGLAALLTAAVQHTGTTPAGGG